MMLAATCFLAVSCEKTINTSNPQTEDNPNGGGGNNIAASAVPAAVISVFNSRYTGVSGVQWKLINSNYKAQFFIGSVKWETTFSASGTLLLEEHF